MQQSTYFKLCFWVALIVGIGVFISAVHAILLPFVVGLLVAYFLDPLADKLEEAKVPRSLASIMIVTSFGLLIVLIGAFIMPVLVAQATKLIANLPHFVADINDKYIPRLWALLDRLNPDMVQNLKDSASKYMSEAVTVSGAFAAGFVKSGVAFLNLVSLIFISPIVAFYILRDWDHITAKVDSWLPRKHAATIRQQLRLMDRAISGFVRGQTNVCMLLAIFYATGLSLVGLESGFLIGFMTGAFSFIPYVGMMLGMATGLIVAFLTTHDMQHVLTVLGVFLVGQFIEGNFIAPKLVGDKVGVHPVWIMFALLAGGVLMGFLGILIAVPALAVIAVLVRFALQQYLQSSLYLHKPKAARKA
jgi:predicted PurR-regulated permease PerM